MKRFFLILIILLSNICVFSQNIPNCFRISLSDKKNSPFSIDQPQAFLSERALNKRAKFNIAITEEDLPVNQTYIQEIAAINDSIIVLTQSKWANTVTIFCPDSTALKSIEELPFVNGSTAVAYYNEEIFSPKENFVKKQQQTKGSQWIPQDYGYSYSQLAIHHADLLHDAGYKGKNMLISVIDCGWHGFDSIPYFQEMIQNGQLIGTRDLIPGKKSIYDAVDDGHGTGVRATICANVPDSIIGAAPAASFFFIRSEDTRGEYPIELDYWMQAAEIADSIGSDIITSSLGYSTFDDSLYYPNSYAQCDGSSLVSQAATKAAHKGMIVCVSAGNLGNKPWNYISIPSDAHDILSVGAIGTDSSLAAFSSWGPSYDGRVKPDVVAVGSWTCTILPDGLIGFVNGTSLSCPLIAGISACLWQALPDKSSLEIMQIIRECSHQYETPDNFYGYGIPDIYAAYLKYSSGIETQNMATGSVYLYPNPCNEQCFIHTDTSLNHAQINLFNIQGQLIFTQNETQIDNHYLFNTSYLKPGLYIMQISGFDQAGRHCNSIQKIIKQ